MSANQNPAGRLKGKRKLAGATLVIAAAALFLTTEAPHQLSAAIGGSTALAELAARSPGMRVGGVALKSKASRSALAPVAKPGPAAGIPDPAVATVLGTSAGPAIVLPETGAIGPGGFPTDFVSPTAPGAPSAGPGAEVPSGGFTNVPFPPSGGFPIFVPGGGGPGGNIPGGETPGGETPEPPIAPPPPPPVTVPVPEPEAWLLLIAGFGLIGSAMRRRRRVQFA